MKTIKTLCFMLLICSTHFAMAVPYLLDTEGERPWKIASTHTPPEEEMGTARTHSIYTEPEDVRAGAQSTTHQKAYSYRFQQVDPIFCVLWITGLAGTLMWTAGILYSDYMETFAHDLGNWYGRTVIPGYTPN